jgi:hypothetical protein
MESDGDAFGLVMFDRSTKAPENLPDARQLEAKSSA